jgi:hypothetical protein
MKVKELIAELQALNPEAEVIDEDNYEIEGASAAGSTRGAPGWEAYHHPDRSTSEVGVMEYFTEERG